MTEADRRATLEAIAFGADSRISPSDRVRAIEQLAALPVPAAEREVLTPEQVELELHAFGMPAAIAVARGPEAVEPPIEEADVRELLEEVLAVNDLLEARLASAERALAYERRHRLLPPAPVLE